MRDVKLVDMPSVRDRCYVTTGPKDRPLDCGYRPGYDCQTGCAFFDTETAEGETFATCKGYFIGRLPALAKVEAAVERGFAEGLDAAARYLEAMTSDDLFVNRIMHAKRIRDLGR